MRANPPHVQKHIRDIRHADVVALKPMFPPGARVLELGGGNGYQASIIASWGCRISSIDIEAPPPGEAVFFPVQLYDGLRIPFADREFDVVFSSSVLEHVPQPVELLKDVRRVTKPGAVGLHVMPSAVWRFWTLLAHYPYLVKRLVWPVSPSPADPSRGRSPVRRSSMWQRAQRLIVSGAHGEYPSALSELYFFSRRRWSSVFVQSGFQVVHASSIGFFYTGYRLCPSLPLGIRRALALVFGRPAHVFTLQCGHDAPPEHRASGQRLR